MTHLAARLATRQGAQAADEDAIHLSLTQDEALVLFDFLVRYAESDDLETVDQAEQRALWNLYSLLEKSLV